MPRFALLAGLAGLTFALVAPAPASAQTDPATRSLIERLRPEPGGHTRGIRVPSEAPAPDASTRGIRLPAEPSAAAAPAAPAMPAAAPTPVQRQVAAPAPRRETTAPPGVAAVSLTVNFPSGSASLTPDAERALAPLGRALASNDLAAYRFRIEGHTDTVGDSAMNNNLSDRRADAVRGYLVARFGVAANRLEVVGLGDRQLLVPTPPQTDEPRNRRVQVLNIGG